MLVASPALAKDRLLRARTLFNAACGRCHTVALTAPRGTRPHAINLAWAALKMSDPELRAWMADPQRQKPGTICEADKADPVLADLVIALLRATPIPAARPLHVPPRSDGPPPRPLPPRNAEAVHR